MPTLDQLAGLGMVSGPTIDTNKEIETPLYRQEPFQLDAGGPVALSLKQRPRPVTHRMDHTLRAGHARVLTRVSNLNPDNAGGDAVTSVWGLNDPNALAQDPAAPQNNRMMIGLLLTGVAAGAAAWFLSKRA